MISPQISKFPSACVVIVWFGPLPPYYPLWQSSIKYNHGLDWVIIGDSLPLQKDNDIPNLEYINMELGELISRLNKCGIDTKAESFYPYKLCDYRPAYGCLFADILEKYNYWAHGDLDLVYGDIHKAIPLEIWEHTDIIGCDKTNRISGPLCFYKNSEFCNKLYEKINPSLFVSDKYEKIDEIKMTQLIRRVSHGRQIEGNPEFFIFFEDGNRAALTYDFRRRELSNPIEWKEGQFYKDGGPVTIAYFHFGGGKTARLRDTSFTDSLRGIQYPISHFKVGPTKDGMIFYNKIV